MAKSLTSYLDNANLPAVDGNALANALNEAADEATTGGASSVDYLSFSGKSGEYSLGRDQSGIDPDQLYLVEPHSFIEGWLCWKNSKPIARIEWSVLRRAEQSVHKDSLEDHGPYRESSGEGWQQLLGFGLLTCDNAFAQVKFSSTSKSGRNSIGDLMKAIGVRSAAEEPDMPMIYFGATEFEAQGNKNYKPLLDVEAWVSRESAAAFLAGEMSKADLIDGHTPKKKRKKAAAKKKRK
jgi:hypothetical protein